MDKLIFQLSLLILICIGGVLIFSGVLNLLTQAQNVPIWKNLIFAVLPYILGGSGMILAAVIIKSVKGNSQRDH